MGARWTRNGRNRKNHIKFAYLLRSKSTEKYSKNSEIPKYLFAYLTDDNRVYFDEFQLMERKYFIRGTVRSFIKKVKNHYIDSNTIVYYYFGEGRYRYTDIMFLLWDLYHLGIQFNMTRVPLGVTCNSIIHAFRLDLPKFRNAKATDMGAAMARLNKVYDIILENHVCPWINDTFNQRIELIKKSRRRMYRLATLGLLHLVVKQKVSIPECRQKKEEEKKEEWQKPVKLHMLSRSS